MASNSKELFAIWSKWKDMKLESTWLRARESGTDSKSTPFNIVVASYTEHLKSD